MRIAVLSDVHSNSVALEAVLRHAFKEGKCESVIFLGDLVGYGPDPIKVLDIAKCKFEWSVWGNHDASFLEVINLLEKEAGEEIKTDDGKTLSIRETLAEGYKVWKKKDTPEFSSAMSNISKIAEFIDQEHKGLSVTNGAAIDSILRNIFLMKVKQQDDGWYFKQEPGSGMFGPKVVDINGFKLVLNHGTLNNPKDEYLFPWHCNGDTFFLRHAQIEKIVESFDSERLCVFSGHTHVPLYLRVDEANQTNIVFEDLVYTRRLKLGNWLTLINPGSVGKPRDLDPRASYAILDTSEEDVVYYRVPYDIHITVQDMQSQYFDNELIEQLKKAKTLSNGLRERDEDLLYKRKSQND